MTVLGPQLHRFEALSLLERVCRLGREEVLTVAFLVDVVPKMSMYQYAIYLQTAMVQVWVRQHSAR